MTAIPLRIVSELPLVALYPMPRSPTSLELLKPLTLKNTQMWLSRGDDGVFWKVRIWAAKLNDPKATAEIGDVYISPEDGKIIRADLHIERVN